MTGLEIKDLVEKSIGVTIENSDALTGINAGILKMGSIIEAEVSSSAYTAYTWYSLPANCSRVTEINRPDTTNSSYLGYRISSSGQKILFADADNYIIHYERKPVRLSAISETPEIHIDYHDSLATYLKGWVIYEDAIDDGEKSEGLRYMEVNFVEEWKAIRKSLKGSRPAQFYAQR
jgi:hypothetical protein